MEVKKMEFTKYELETELAKIFEKITGERMLFRRCFGNCAYKHEQLETLFKWFEIYGRRYLKFCEKSAKCVSCGNIQDKKWDSCQKCFYTHIDEEGLHSIEIK